MPLRGHGLEGLDERDEAAHHAVGAFAVLNLKPKQAKFETVSSYLGFTC